MDPERRFAIIAQAKKKRSMDQIYNRSVKAYPPPITEHRLSYAFESRTEPKLISLLSDPVEDRRLTALTLLSEHLVNHEKIIRVLQNNILDPLLKLLRDENNIARQRSSAIIERIAGIHAGVEAILDHESAFKVILQSVNDPDPSVCVNINSIIYLICSTMFVDRAVENGVIPVLISILHSTEDKAKLMILDSLCYSNERLKEAITISLEANIVPLLVRILQEGPEREKIVRVPKSATSVSSPSRTEEESSIGSHQGAAAATSTPTEGEDGDYEEQTIVEGHKSTVLERTCSLLTTLCGTKEGKTEAIKNDTIPVIVDLLSDTNAALSLLIAAMELLMAITTDVDGQARAIECDVCPLLLDFLRSDQAADPQLALNTIKTISNIAVNPKGREQLQDSVEQLTFLSKLQDLLIAESAKEALTRVTWIP